MKIELLLLLFKHYARNHTKELFTRYIQDRLHKERNRDLSSQKLDYLISRPYYTKTACGVTAKALLVAIGGPLHESNQHDIPYLHGDINTQEHFTALLSNINSNAQILSDNLANFITYQFTLHGRVQRINEHGSSSHDFGLIFLVIQCIDINNQPNYCLLLSSGDKFSLFQYLTDSEAQHNSHIMNYKVLN